MSPDQSVSVGTKISFRVTTKKPGYLLLIDIDANGKMSQVFPSPEMIVQSQEATTNFIKPGEEFTALWGSGYDKVQAFVEVEHRGKLLQRFWTGAGQTQVLIRQKVTEAMRGEVD